LELEFESDEGAFMKVTNILWIIGVVIYFCLAVKDFRQSDWGIRKEFLHSKNRSKWQKRNAVLELGVAIFGALSIWSYTVLKVYEIFLVFGIITIGVFFLSVLNVKTIKEK
jgi:hypothetical protein